MNYEDIVKEHINKFGVEPVITGIDFANSGDAIDAIVEAIINGIPYVEEEITDNRLT